MDLTESDSDQPPLDSSKSLKCNVTEYYKSLSSNDLEDPIHKCFTPSDLEISDANSGNIDPLGEESQKTTKCVVHRYPDRALFLVTDQCFVNCRYCTRSRHVDNNPINDDDITEALKYIQNTKSIRDVIVSGGDPLTLTNEKLKSILDRLMSIDHIEMVRIGTKALAANPSRIDQGLLDILQSYEKPIYISIHVTHPKELTESFRLACLKLIKTGAVIGSQTVLLKGINDNIVSMRELMTGLLKCRVRPYYIYICDDVVGAKHFRTSIATGLEIMDGLRGWISGYGVPQLILDSPGGKGKIPLIPQYLQKIEGNKYTFRNYENKEVIYFDVE